MKITMNKSKEKLSINEAFEKYERYMNLNNFSIYTINLVQRCLKNFNLFLENDDFPISKLNNEIIEDYILWLKEQGNKDTTINIKLSNMRMFIYWAIKNNYLDEFKINLVKEEKTIRKTYTQQEIISNPDYIAKHPTKNSLEFIKQLDELMIVVIRIKSKGNLAFRTAYPLTEEQLQDYIKSGTAIKM